MITMKLVRATTASLALFLASLFPNSPASAASKFQSAIVPAPVVFDSGSDLQGHCSAGAMSVCAVGSVGNAVCAALAQGTCQPDGTNDSQPIPACSGAPADPLLPLCISGPNKGEACDPTNGTTCGDAGPVPGTGNILCGFRGEPDGLTVGDVPASGETINPKSKVQIADTKIKASIVFDNPGLNTFPGGSCDGGEYTGGGSADGDACNSSKDCGDKYDRTTNTGGLGTCVNGDEFVLQCDVAIGSNRDNSPACNAPNQGAGSCMMGITTAGVNGGATPVPGPLLGLTGVCSGGVRHGQACGQTGACVGLCAPPDAPNIICQDNGDCPISGSCSAPAPGTCSCALGSPLNLAASGDEVCFRASIDDPIPLGDIVLCSLCPFSTQISFRFEVSNGKGKVKADLADHPLFAFVPDGVPIEVLGCAVHENTAPTESVSLLGLYRNQTGSVPSFFKRPCPDVSLPLGSDLGLNVDVGVAPIIGVTGMVGEKGPGRFFLP